MPISTDSIADDELRALYQEAKNRITELEAERANLMPKSEHNEIVSGLQTQINEQKLDIDTARNEAEDNSSYAELGREILEKQRTRTEHAYRTLKGNKVNDPKSQRNIEKIQTSTNYGWLVKEMDKCWEILGEHQKKDAAHDADIDKWSEDPLKGAVLNQTL